MLIASTFPRTPEYFHGTAGVRPHAAPPFPETAETGIQRSLPGAP